MAYFGKFLYLNEGKEGYKRIDDLLNIQLETLLDWQIIDSFTFITSLINKSFSYDVKKYNHKIETILSQGEKLYQRWSIEDQISFFNDLSNQKITKGLDKMVIYTSK